MASAAFEIAPDGVTYGPTPQSVDPAGSLVRCRLLNVAGIQQGKIVWTIEGTNNETVAKPVITLSGLPFGQIAEFTVLPGLNQAFLIQCEVNGGPDLTGETTTRARGKAFVINHASRQPIAFYETNEGEPIRGWTSLIDRINDLVAVGDVIGPGASTDNDIALFDGPTGEIIKDSGVTIADVLATSAAYADAGDASTLTAAETYADTGDVSTLASAEAYADSVGTAVLAAAEAYADAGDVTTLTAAEAYTDSAVAPLVTGPVSATDLDIVVFNGTTGKIVKDGGYTIAAILAASGPPSGAAGGDLSGTYPNPTVAKANGSSVPAGGALTTGNVLQVSGVASLSYGPVNLAGGANYVSGSLPTANQVAQSMGGDLSGTTSAATVTAIHETSGPTQLVIGSIADGYGLKRVAGTLVGYALPTALPPSGSAGGDLSGTYPNPTVAKINTSSVPAGGALTTGNVLQVTGASTLSYGAVNLAGGANYVTGSLPAGNQAAQTMAGDVTGTTAVSVVAKVNGSTIPAGGALTTGNGPYVSGSSALTYSALNLAGGTGWVTGLLPSGNQAAQTLSGDVTGSTSSSTVAKINGATVPAAGSLTTGNVLQVTGASALSYAAVNLAGGAGYVTGVLPKANTYPLTWNDVLTNGATSGGIGVITIASGDSIVAAAGSGAVGVNLVLTGGLGAATFAGGNATVTAGAGGTSGNGGVASLVSGVGGTTGIGGTTLVTGGAGGSSSGNAGGVTVAGGTPVSGNGGTVTVSASAGVGGNSSGGLVTGTGGNAIGSGTGGNVSWIAGSGGTTGTAGTFVGKGGPGGSSSGDGGSASLLGGVPVAGAGGAVFVTGANGVGTSQAGGAATVQAGNSTTAVAGGVASLVSGSSATGVGGTTLVTGGAGGSSSGNAGGVTISGGTPVSGNGAGVTLTGTNGVGTSKSGGSISGTAGNASATTAAGGSISWTAGNSAGVSTPGDINLTAGVGAGSSSPTRSGNINILCGNASNTVGAGLPAGTITIGGTTNGGMGGTGGLGTAINMIGGDSASTATGIGGAVVVAGGKTVIAVSTGGCGSLTVRGGEASNGDSNGGSLIMRGGDAHGNNGNNRDGGNVTLRAGNCVNTTGVNGTVVITGGDGTTIGGNTTSAGGLCSMTGGRGGTISGAGGSSSIVGGAGGSGGGTGGAALVTGGAATGTNNTGGAATVTAGAGIGNLTGGVASLVSGAGGATGAGATTLVTGGAGGATSGDAGGVTCSAGTPIAGHGGSFTGTATDGVGTNKNGGNWIINVGKKTGAGTDGTLQINGNVTAATASNTIGGLTLPALAASYLIAVVGGTTYKVPLYAA